MTAGPVDDAGDAGAVVNREAVLASFDDAAADVFAALARLTGGDRNRTTALLIDTFLELEGDPTRQVTDRREVVDCARRTFLRHGTGATPSKGLSPVEAVVLDLAVVEHRSPAEIGTLIAERERAVVALLEGARRRFTATFDGEDIERVLRRREIWLDDSTRRSARAALAEPAVVAAHHAGGANVVTGPRRAQTPTALRSGRGRAGLAAVAVAAVGVVSISVWSSRSTPGSTGTVGLGTQTNNPLPFTPPSSTSTLDTGTGTAGTTSLGPGYAFDPLPAGYVVLGARNIDPSLTGQTTGWLEVWASSDATRTSGRWLGVLVVPGAPAELPLAPAATSRRVMVGSEFALLWTQPDGVSRLSVGRGGQGSLELESFGVSGDDLIALAGDTSLNSSNQTLYGHVAIGVLSGMDVQLARGTSATTLTEAVFSPGASAWVAYGSTATGDTVIVVTTAVEPYDLLATSLLGPGSIIPSGLVSGSPASDQPVVMGEANEELLLRGAHTPTAFVRFHRGDRTVTVLGTPGLGVLTGLAASASLATAPSWQGLLEQRGAAPQLSDPQPVAIPTSIGVNTLANGTTWSIELSDQTGVTLSASERRGAPGSTASTDPSQSVGLSGTAAVQPDAPHPVSIWNTPDAQLVIVMFDHDPGAGLVNITTNDGVVTPVPIRRVGQASVWGAGLAVVDASGLRVTMTFGDGNFIDLA